MNRIIFSAMIAIGLMLSAPNTTFGAQRPKPFRGQWIACPGASAHGYGVYYFSKTIRLTAVPAHYRVRVSGDNRYKLFVNGKLVSLGPHRFDVDHWNYATVDLAPVLRVGSNTVTAQVWNEGEDKPEANVSLRTGFILDDTTPEGQLSTDGSWSCMQDEGYQPIHIDVGQFYVTGPGEAVDFSRRVSDFASADLSTASWPKAVVIAPAYLRDQNDDKDFGMQNGWLLQPTTLPDMELKEERTLKKVDGPDMGKIPAHTTARILLDNGVLTNAFPQVYLHSGKGASLTLTYAESLFEKDYNKGNRNEWRGKFIRGRRDSLQLCGGRQAYTTLSWRTYRYIQLDVRTADEPLSIDSITGLFIGYPLERKSTVNTSDKELQQILEVGWRTARLCAIETYMDCPYYEQLQYLGDARIQALNTLFNVGDCPLVRNFLYQADASRTADGVTQSRYPTQNRQLIPPYALMWILSIDDYLRYADNADFVRQRLQGMRDVLAYFARFQQEDGSVVGLPRWNFSDWVYLDGWLNGALQPGKDGCTALMDLQLLMALQAAECIEHAVGSSAMAEEYGRKAAALAQTVRTKYWDEGRGLFADLPEHNSYSQHTNALAILTHIVEGEQAKAIAQRIENDKSLTEASIYFKFYTYRAMAEAGLADHYLQWLDTWRTYLQLGLTTWGETSDVLNTRSDCHAWGSSPNIEFYRTVLGIDSDAPGFTRVVIRPALGNYKHIGGSMPHPKGEVSVDYQVGRKSVTAKVTLPQGVTGRLLWQGQEYALQGGEQTLQLPNKQ
jgi:hypothetical protein